MTTVAVLGTGKMGAGMARQLAGHGHDVSVWNRSHDKAEPLSDVAKVAGSPGEAVAGADVVLTMLFDAASVVDVLGEIADAVTADTVLVQTTTVGLDIVEVAATAEKLGIHLVDAPVLGTRKPAEEGQLVVLAAGEPGLRDTVDPVLDAIGSRTLWVADAVGPASQLKLACNAWLASITAATAQSIALAQGLGLDPHLFLEAIEGGPMDTAYAHLKGEAMISGEMPVAFTVDGIRKDVGLITAAAERGGVDSRLLEAVAGLLADASEHGHGGDDIAAVRAAFSAVDGG